MDEIKFQEIKVGDKVLITKKLSYGWRSDLSFWVAVPVTRVTKAQIEVDGKMYWKKDGAQVGEPFSSAKTLNCKEDQIDQYLDAKRKFKAISDIRTKISSFEKSPIPGLVARDLDLFEDLNKAFERLLIGIVNKE